MNSRSVPERPAVGGPTIWSCLDLRIKDFTRRPPGQPFLSKRVPGHGLPGAGVPCHKLSVGPSWNRRLDRARNHPHRSSLNQMSKHVSRVCPKTVLLRASCRIVLMVFPQVLPGRTSAICSEAPKLLHGHGPT